MMKQELSFDKKKQDPAPSSDQAEITHTHGASFTMEVEYLKASQHYVFANPSLLRYFTFRSLPLIERATRTQFPLLQWISTSVVHF